MVGKFNQKSLRPQGDLCCLPILHVFYKSTDTFHLSTVQQRFNVSLFSVIVSNFDKRLIIHLKNLVGDIYLKNHFILKFRVLLNVSLQMVISIFRAVENPMLAETKTENES